MWHGSSLRFPSLPALQVPRQHSAVKVQCSWEIEAVSVVPEVASSASAAAPIRPSPPPPPPQAMTSAGGGSSGGKMADTIRAVVVLTVDKVGAEALLTLYRCEKLARRRLRCPLRCAVAGPDGPPQRVLASWKRAAAGQLECGGRTHLQLDRRSHAGLHAGAAHWGDLRVQGAVPALLSLKPYIWNPYRHKHIRLSHPRTRLAALRSSWSPQRAAEASQHGANSAHLTPQITASRLLGLELRIPLPFPSYAGRCLILMRLRPCCGRLCAQMPTVVWSGKEATTAA